MRFAGDGFEIFGSPHSSRASTLLAARRRSLFMRLSPLLSGGFEQRRQGFDLLS
jgi:hypothetical protein